jgi:hypothetical protein
MLFHDCYGFESYFTVYSLQPVFSFALKRKLAASSLSTTSLMAVRPSVLGFYRRSGQGWP